MRATQHGSVVHRKPATRSRPRSGINRLSDLVITLPFIWFWPLVLARPSGAASVLLGVGIAAGFLCFLAVVANPYRVSQNRRIAILVLIFGLWALLLTDLSTIRTSVPPQVFLGVVLPIALWAASRRAVINVGMVFVGSSLFTVLAVVQPSLAFRLNPISVGHLAWVAAISALILQQDRVSRVPLIVVQCALSAAVLFQVENLGPFLAGGSALLSYSAVSLSAAGTNTPRKWIMRLLLVPLGLISLRFVFDGVVADFTSAEGTNNTTVREIAFRAAFQEHSPLGSGFRRLVVNDDNTTIDLVHTHNFLADAYVFGGVLGFGIVLWLSIRGVKRMLRSRPVELPLYVGVLVAHLTSGGLLSPVLWIVLMMMNKGPTLAARSKTGNTPESGW